MDALDKCLEEFKKEAQTITTLDELNRLKGRYVGRKGILNDSLKQMKSFSPEKRRETGQKINHLKSIMEKEISQLHNMLETSSGKHKAVDLTLPGNTTPPGSFHPITLALNRIIEIFLSLGFRVEEGPEIETEYYNFEALNFPAEHPARDAQDSFFLPYKLLLRTHTSPVQIRTMEKYPPPLKVVVPGRCYRRDPMDATHSMVFHQVEGLVVAEGISMGHLKGTIELFSRRLFGPARNVRFRPSFFPFTEPSAEVDISCGVCGGKGCRSCGYSGWLEIMGAGLVHPNVFRAAGYDPEEVRGFAFGMGVERIAMLKYGIPDIRLFFENDVCFLNQFRGL